MLKQEGREGTGDTRTAGAAILSALVAIAEKAPLSRWVAESPLGVAFVRQCAAMLLPPGPALLPGCQVNQPLRVDLLFLCRERKGKVWFASLKVKQKPWD